MLLSLDNATIYPCLSLLAWIPSRSSSLLYYTVAPNSILMSTLTKNEVILDGHDEGFHQARQAAEEEHDLTPWQALRLHPKSVMWSVLLSNCIIMEGYDIVLIYSFFAQPAFARRYGQCDSSGACQITASWQAGLGNAVGCGTIIGAFANGYFCQRYGYRPVLLTSLVFICAFIAISFSAPSLPVLLVGQFLCGIPWVSAQSRKFGIFTNTYRAFSQLWHLPMRARSAPWPCGDISPYMSISVGLSDNSSLQLYSRHSQVVPANGHIAFRLPSSGYGPFRSSWCSSPLPSHRGTMSVKVTLEWQKRC